MSIAFEAAWGKYNRAARDLGRLHDNARRFFAREPYRLDVEPDGGASAVVRVRIREDPPPIFGVLVGSVAHQANSALNHVTWALAVRNLGEVEASKPRIRNRIDFPICDDGADFRKRDVLKHVGADAAAKLEELQPFQRRSGAHGKSPHPLLLLKELADADKHRVLPATYGAVRLSDLRLTWEPNAPDPAFERLHPEDDRSLQHGTALWRLRFADSEAAATLRVAEQPDVDLVFESDTWAGLSLFAVGDCLATADRCISVLSSLFPDVSWPPASHDPMAPYEW